jgi:hypothetical protein
LDGREIAFGEVSDEEKRWGKAGAKYRERYVGGNF